jgi:predicted TIM-barrel fold metal-dependent hydrolase
VEEVYAAGACLLKWLPLHQNIAADDPRTVAVLRKCADLGLPVLLHAGDEFMLTTNRPAHSPVAPWLQTLRTLRANGAMPTTIVAHVATSAVPWGDLRSHPILVEALLDEFADAPLYADMSALAAWTKVRYLRRLARRPELHGKLLFGSDFPVPTGLWGIRRELGRDYSRLTSIKSWPQQAAAAYRRLGFDEIMFHRAAELLPNVSRFEQAADAPA